MKQLFTYRLNRIAVRTAIASFGIGSMLFLLCLMTNSSLVLGFSFTFLGLYTVVTIVSIFVILGHTIIHFKAVQEHIMALIIVLLNIPVAILYINFLT